MTEKEALKRLKSARFETTEVAHEMADEVLCELLLDLGYVQVVKAWAEIPKWYRERR